MEIVWLARRYFNLFRFTGDCYGILYERQKTAMKEISLCFSFLTWALPAGVKRSEIPVSVHAMVGCSVYSSLL
jgi:hypothetical protein